MIAENGDSKTEWGGKDLLALAVVLVLSSLLLWPGLAVRSLWGPEGHWAMIIREMIQSGNYFLPTVNGIVDWDKPLLSYWAALPFSFIWGVTEATVRIPSIIAAQLVTLVVFVMGRRLFGLLTGVGASLALLTAGMFSFWSRIGCAELLNTLAIWVMLWAFVAGGAQGRLPWVMLFYGAASVGALCKGPVAPAVGIFSLAFYSVAQAAIDTKGKGWHFPGFRDRLKDRLQWIASGRALLGMALGLILFALLLYLQVTMTGSWLPASLMWKENVVRFFFPFDHDDPPYAYLFHIMVYFAPWSLFAIASLWQVRSGRRLPARNWVCLAGMGIFLFFVLSGSRRSYYILPLLPALALLVAYSVGNWLRGENAGGLPMRIAALGTSALLPIIAMGLIYVYRTMPVYRHTSLLAVALVAMIAGLVCLTLFLRRMDRAGMALLIIFVILIESWVFTVGMSVAERKRTLRDFAQNVTAALAPQPGKVCLFQEATASLLFYLQMSGGLEECPTVEAFERFRTVNGEGYILVDLNEARDDRMVGYLDKLYPVTVQNTDPAEQEERFCLLRFSPRPGSETTLAELRKKEQGHRTLVRLGPR